MHFLYPVALSTLLCFFLGGCAEHVELRVPVSGLVLIDGQPLASGSIRFVPTSGRPVSSNIAEDGSFKLAEHSVSENKSELNVLPGNYRVAVSAPEIIDVESEEVRWLAPSRYADFRSSGIEVEIDGKAEELLIELTWEGDEQIAEDAESSLDAEIGVAKLGVSEESNAQLGQQELPKK